MTGLASLSLTGDIRTVILKTCINNQKFFSSSMFLNSQLGTVKKLIISSTMLITEIQSSHVKIFLLFPLPFSNTYIAMFHTNF